MIKYTPAIEEIILALNGPKTLEELTRFLGRSPNALQRAISGGYVIRIGDDPIRYVRGPEADAVIREIRRSRQNKVQGPLLSKAHSHVLKERSNANAE